MSPYTHPERKGLGLDTNANAQSSTSTHKGINMMKYVAEWLERVARHIASTITLQACHN